MKRIEYISPVDYIRGNISGRQTLTYGEGETSAYGAPSGEKTAANDYQPRMVAKVAHLYEPWRIKYFQVRTRSSINMTATMRHNLALMGGVGALVGSLLRHKESAIYAACLAACPKYCSVRQLVSPALRAGLDQKSAEIAIADGVSIVNPWVSSDTPNVPVSAEIIAKFSSELSNV